MIRVQFSIHKRVMRYKTFETLFRQKKKNDCIVNVLNYG